MVVAASRYAFQLELFLNEDDKAVGSSNIDRRTRIIFLAGCPFQAALVAHTRRVSGAVASGTRVLETRHTRSAKMAAVR